MARIGSSDLGTIGYDFLVVGTTFQIDLGSSHLLLETRLRARCRPVLGDGEGETSDLNGSIIGETSSKISIWSKGISQP